MGVLRRLFLRGDRKATATPESYLDRVHRESTEAADALEAAMSTMPSGTIIQDLPEYKAFRRAAALFHDEAERQAYAL